METKYTSDGKKVVIVGKLNSQETIVQEVFIVNNQEVPSGENFVVKSLHDAPAVSWKQKEEEKLQKRLTDLETSVSREEENVKKLKNQLRLQADATKKHLDYLGKVNGISNEKSFQLFSDFILGNLKYVVDEIYCVIYPLQSELIQFGNDYYDRAPVFEGLRLVSVFGNDDGSLQYRISEYRDGYGYDRRIITPFYDLESAKEKCLEIIREKGKSCLTDQMKKTAKEFSIEIPEDILQADKERRRESIIKNIAYVQNQLDSYNKSLSEI